MQCVQITANCGSFFLYLNKVSVNVLMVFQGSELSEVLGCEFGKCQGCC